MGITFIQSANLASDAAPNSLQIPINPTGTDNLVAVLPYILTSDPAGGSVLTVIDSEGSDYAQAPGAVASIVPPLVAGLGRTDGWYCKRSVPGATWIRVTFQSPEFSAFKQIVMFEVSGCDLKNPLAQIGTLDNFATNAAQAAGAPVTTKDASEFVCSYLPSFGAVNTVLAPFAGGATDDGGAGFGYVIGSPAVYAPAWSFFGAAAKVCSTTLAFRAPVASPPISMGGGSGAGRQARARAYPAKLMSHRGGDPAIVMALLSMLVLLESERNG